MCFRRTVRLAETGDDWWNEVLIRVGSDAYENDNEMWKVRSAVGQD